MQKKGKTYVLGATKADVPHKDSPSYQGKLKSNSTGQEFTLYDNGKNPKKMDSWDKDEPGAKGARKKLAAISFEKPADKRLPTRGRCRCRRSARAGCATTKHL